jgi:hypothetical protein
MQIKLVAGSRSGYTRLLTAPAEIDIFKQISVPCHVEWGIDAKNICNFSIQLYGSKYSSFRNSFRTENFIN